MEYKLNHLTSVEKKIDVTFAAAEVSENLNATFRRAAQTANVRGFRAGKVPMHLIKQMYGKTVREDVEHYFISSAFQDTITREKLRVVTEPKIHEKSPVAEGQDFTFSFTIEVFPEVKIALQKTTLEYKGVDYSESLIDEEISHLLKRHTEFKPVDRPAQDGDRAVVNFTGSRDGKVIDAASGKEVPVILGAHDFINDFEAALNNHVAGDHFTADVRFPAEYHSRELAGQTVTFDIEVLKIEEGSAPELNEEFLAKHPELPQTVEELRKKFGSDINNYIDNINTQNKQYLYIDNLVKNADFEVPGSFVRAEESVRIEEAQKKNQGRVLSDDEIKKIKEDALWASKRFIILSQLAKDLQVSVSDDEVEEELAKDAARYGIPVEYIKKLFNEDRLNEKRIQIQERKVIERIIENAEFVAPAEAAK